MDLDLERVSIHEVGHGLVALLYGYVVDAVRFDGPPDNPGKVDRHMPYGKDGGDPTWARIDLALFCAGYTAERVVLGDNDERFVNHHHPEADRPMMDQCAVCTLEIQKDVDILNATGGKVPRNKWREALPHMEWARYDALIGEVEKEVAHLLRAHAPSIRPLAEMLRNVRFVRGEDFEREFKRLRSR